MPPGSAGLGQAIDDARSGYFHAEHTKAAIKRGTAEVQTAYAAASKAIVDIEPPAVAAELHRRLTEVWLPQ